MHKCMELIVYCDAMAQEVAVIICSDRGGSGVVEIGDFIHASVAHYCAYCVVISIVTIVRDFIHYLN